MSDDQSSVDAADKISAVTDWVGGTEFSSVTDMVTKVVPGAAVEKDGSGLRIGKVLIKDKDQFIAWVKAHPWEAGAIAAAIVAAGYFGVRAVRRNGGVRATAVAAVSGVQGWVSRLNDLLNDRPSIRLDFNGNDDVAAARRMRDAARALGALSPEAAVELQLAFRGFLELEPDQVRALFLNVR